MGQASVRSGAPRERGRPAHTELHLTGKLARRTGSQEKATQPGPRIVRSSSEARVGAGGRQDPVCRRDPYMPTSRGCRKAGMALAMISAGARSRRGGWHCQSVGHWEQAPKLTYKPFSAAEGSLGRTGTRTKTAVCATYPYRQVRRGTSPVQSFANVSTGRRSPLGQRGKSALNLTGVR